MGVDTAPYLPAIKALKVDIAGHADDIAVGAQTMQTYLLDSNARTPILGRGVIANDENLLRKAEQNLRDASGKPFDERIP